MKVECDQSWIVPCVYPVSLRPPTSPGFARQEFTRLGFDECSNHLN
jgi:hypothetical protein